jgi:DNA polymerase III delta prime subunit
MEKFFNTAGPIKPDLHYQIDPLERVDWEEIHMLIGSQKYFLMHAPRQTGKTTTLLAMMKELNEEGRYACVYANIEGAQAARNDVDKGIDAVCHTLTGSISLYLKDERADEWLKNEGVKTAVNDRLKSLLSYWSRISDKPVVLLLDEVDALVGDTLISLLRQIRAGYAQRPEAFPQSIVLCGVRDIKDYRIQTSGQDIITGGSAFNIKSESLRMGNFSREETFALLQKHTEVTGQKFDEGIFEEIWQDSMGQPWLVNALGYELTWKDRSARDRSTLITLSQYREARERLIYSRATHLDQLTDKLREPRVHRVISQILQAEEGDVVGERVSPDDYQYVEDLGLIQTRPGLKISNRIYQEVIPRELTWAVQTVIVQEQHWYLTEGRHLDTPKLLQAFQQFFREHSDIWLKKFEYEEAAPQLLMQAFLQRIINGGGRINREYALGRKRTDLFIEWPVSEEEGWHGEVQRIVIELKILRKALDATIEKGIEQTQEYSKQVGAEESHLVIFNRNPEISWDEKVWHQRKDGIDIWGC